MNLIDPLGTFEWLDNLIDKAGVALYNSTQKAKDWYYTSSSVDSFMDKGAAYGEAAYKTATEPARLVADLSKAVYVATNRDQFEDSSFVEGQMESVLIKKVLGYIHAGETELGAATKALKETATSTATLGVADFITQAQNIVSDYKAGKITKEQMEKGLWSAAGALGGMAVLSYVEGMMSGSDDASKNEPVSNDNKKGDKVEKGGSERRKSSPGDKHFETESAARREAFRKHDISTTEANNFERKPDYKTKGAKGPKGEPAEVIEAVDVHGNKREIKNHKHGHEFKDTNKHEIPHYHGPKDEHYTYGEKK